LTTQTAGAKRKTTPAVGTPKAPAETSPSDVLGASIAVDAVVLPDSAPPRAEVAVPASTTFRLTPISERSNDNSVVLLALLLLVASGVPAVRQIRSEREYAKVR
jgi:hypothetical protein